MSGRVTRGFALALAVAGLLAASPTPAQDDEAFDVVVEVGDDSVT